MPPRQNVVPTAEKTDSSHQGLEFLFSPLLEEYYNPTHDQAEENNNDQAPNASFQEAEFVNPFFTRVQEFGESSSRNIDNTDVHSFQPQSHDYRWTKDHPLEQVRGNATMPVVRLGINPMIQPEPEDLPKDNPKLEIAVLRFFRKMALALSRLKSDVLKKSLTIGVPLIEDTGFTIETVSIPITVVTPNVPTPTVEMTNDEFQTVGKKKKKGKSKSTNGGQFGGHSVKQNVRYEPKATTSAPKKGATNLGNTSKSSSMKNQPPKATITSTKEGKITMSNSYAALEEESDEDVENVYDESANLFHSKTGESLSTFTTVAG
ncbi:hypothetical protein Tco_0282676 [Tanacetum coccineum]